MDNGVANGVYNGDNIIGATGLNLGVSNGIASGVNSLTKPINVITSGLIFYIDFKNKTSYNGTPNASLQPLVDLTGLNTLSFPDTSGTNLSYAFRRANGGNLLVTNINTSRRPATTALTSAGSNFSADAWYFRTSNISTVIRSIIFNNAQNQGLNNEGWIFAIQGNTPKFLYGRDAQLLAPANDLLNLGQWYHICCVNSTRLINGQYGWIYINGQEVSSYVSRPVGSTITYGLGGPFELFQRTAATNDLFTGGIGEIKIYNRVLSEAEVRHNFLVTKKFYNM